jgi:hypothetical protein
VIVVIQCAATKHKDAGCLESRSGKPVVFVADPCSAPADGVHVYARPDDPFDGRKSWRDVVREYNEHPESNPHRLCPAYRLYGHPQYARLVEAFGLQNTYILSAGWGLIEGSFLTPYYDITFSANAKGESAYKRRRREDQYHDFCRLPPRLEGDIVFLGGRDYVPLFCSLTSSLPNERIVFYNSSEAPDARGCTLERFKTSNRTNWHYDRELVVLLKQQAYRRF